MKIEMERSEYQDAIAAVKKVLDDAINLVECSENVKDHIISYAVDCVDSVWDAIN